MIILIKYLVSIGYVLLLMHYHNNYESVGKQNQDLHGLTKLVMYYTGGKKKGLSKNGFTEGYRNKEKREKGEK